jgi:hypothetical protein
VFAGQGQQGSISSYPGGLMPFVEGCNKQDYTVLFVVGVAEEN